MSRDGSDPTPESGESGAFSDESDETLRQQIRDASTAAFRKVEASAPPSVANRMAEFRSRIRSRRALDTTWRVLVLALGLTLLAAGVVMFVIPGPGFATIILALVVLGSEFTWATRALDPVKSAARRASLAAMDPRKRRRNLILGTMAGVALGLAAWWYLATYGLTMDPVFEWLGGLFG